MEFMDTAFKSGIMVWAPPPVAAHIAIEQLREARNKRTASCHIVLLPKAVYHFMETPLMASIGSSF